MTRYLYRILIELTSRKWISKMTGKFTKSSLSRKLIPRFAKIYRIRLEEAEKSIEEYASLNEFFTRRLRSGIRPIDDTTHAVVSPVDGLVTSVGRIESGLIMNIKGQSYTLDELLNRSPRTVNYENGFYYVLYLSPTDYHRIHSPIDGKIVEKEHIPGRVYPVNSKGLRYMRQVLSRNERLITYIQHDHGEVAVVKVGALNVSSIQYVTPLPNQLERGSDLAYFEFGSTVVLLMSNNTFEASDYVKLGDQLKMGEKLGRIRIHEKS